MIEIHSHLLPNIDDGVTSFEESINTIKRMIDLGYKEIVITPHYINGTKYNTNNKDKYNLFVELKKRIKENGIDVKLYLGNEIFLDENIIKDLKNGNCCPINSGKYVLVEIPRNDSINNLNDIIFKLLNKGLIPIMAHPERYMLVKKDNNILNDWVDRGMLLQINMESISDKYGNETKKLTKYILKNNLATLIGGDIHHDDSIFFDNFNKNKRKIVKIIGEEKFNELINDNPLKIINSQNIQ